MPQLLNFPMVSQRTDGDVNADFDCVPTSIAAALEWLTGRTFTGGEIKDAVLGAGYTGGTGASQFVQYCKDLKVDLYPIDSTDAVALVNDMRSELTRNHPVLITEPDPYMPEGSGFTHVCVAYMWDDNSVTVMDPFIDAPVTKTNQEWASQLQDNEVWGLRPMPVPANWKDDGTTLTAPNGHVAVLGFRQKVLDTANWDPGNQPLENERGTSQIELHNAATPGTRQIFRDSMMVWTQSGGVKYSAAGAEILACYNLIAKLQQGQTTAGPTNAKNLATQAIALLQQI